MEIKIHCKCGLRYQFEAESVNGKLPVPVYCPACGADGTVEANSFIQLATALGFNRRRKGRGGTDVIENPSAKRRSR